MNAIGKKKLFLFSSPKMKVQEFIVLEGNRCARCLLFASDCPERERTASANRRHGPQQVDKGAEFASPRPDGRTDGRTDRATAAFKTSQALT